MIRVSFSTSRLNSMQLCWQLYDYSYVQNLIPVDKKEFLERGALIHTFFRHYYKEKLVDRWKNDPSQQGIVLDEATNICRRDAVDMSLTVKQTEEYIKVAKENLIFHAQDGMVVYAVEEPFSRVIYELPETEKKEGIQLIYEGIVDLVASLPNAGVMVWDHKTEQRKSNTVLIDNQFTGEAWAFDVDAVCVNKVGLQTTVAPKEKFSRPILDYSKDIIDEWRTDTIKTVLEAIERHRRDLNGYPDWPRNRTSCTKFGSCAYIAVCSAKPVVRPVKLHTYYKDKPEHDIYRHRKQVTEVDDEA